MFLLLVTIISLLLAVVMSVIAWRVGQEERRRADARVAALAAEIHDINRPVRFTPRPVDELEIRPTGGAAVTLPASALFSTQRPRSPHSAFAVIGIGAGLRIRRRARRDPRQRLGARFRRSRRLV